MFIADLPDQPPDVMQEAAADLARAGLAPVPHLVARNVASREQMLEVFGRLCHGLGISQVFLTGGDRARPAGPFGSALDVIESGALQELTLTRLAFPCYPEGHPRIGAADLARSLERKIAAAFAAGMEVLLISQFAFDADPVLAFVRDLRDRGIAAPLRIGTAGPADRNTLLRFGRELGAGPSLSRIEAAQRGDRKITPDAFLAPIARAAEADPRLGIAGIHLFPFGDTAACLDWARAASA